MGYSRVLENYEFFRDKMADADLEVVYAGVSRLVVVDVTLDRANDDPQMVFESLNSTGLDLTQADLIRNYILMRLPEQEQTRLYQTYWRKIEELFRDAGGTFDAFARDYMALMKRASKQARGAEIYQEFRAFIREQEGDGGVEDALDEMLRFARYHAAFSMARGGSDRLRPALHRLSRLASVAAILVMRLNDCHHRLKTLSETDFVEALALLESYVFRRSVCGMQTRGYWKAFSTLAFRIDDGDPLLSLKVSLKRQRGKYRFPRDEEFARELKARDVYNMRTCHYLLDRLENHRSREPTDTTGYTVEHIMPQNESLPAAWRSMLGDGWEEVHETWLHRLGNVTLTGYNSEYSDRPFEEKKTIEGGFNQSSVRLNEFVRNQPVWTAQQMEERSELLAKRAETIWPRLDVSDEAVHAAEREDLKARASKRDVKQVPMSPRAREMFLALRDRIKAQGPDIIEMAEPRSVSYHAADFFVEVLPRQHRVLLLLDLDFDECDFLDDRAADATEYKFIVNARHSGGVCYSLDDVRFMDGALHLVRQAYEAASE
jgi:predicted transport protein